MARLSVCIFAVSIIIATPAFTLAQSVSDLDLNRIVKRIDELYRSSSSYSELEMQVVTPHWQRTLTMNVWTEGMKKTFIRLTSPPKEEGVATLRIGNEMWNYLPKTSKVIKVPPSMMMNSWMGSDFTNDDLVKESSLLDDYNYSFATVDSAVPDWLYVQFVPKENKPIVWGKIVVAAMKEGYIPIWERYYDEKGNLMRTMNFSDVREFSGRKIPAVMELIPESKEGNRTVITYKEVKFDLNLNEEIFSLRNLRSP